LNVMWDKSTESVNQWHNFIQSCEQIQVKPSIRYTNADIITYYVYTLIKLLTTHI
jgi:hypothetical protein